MPANQSQARAEPAQAIGTKRKFNPSSSASSQTRSQRQSRSAGVANRQTHAQARKRQRTQDARFIASQTTSQAYFEPSQQQDAQSTPAPPADAGQINVDKFVRAHEFEIAAFESSLRKAGGGLNTRAFQGVPRDLRRRTASHDVRRVPKRLQARARREMVEDNTPGPAMRSGARRRERKAKAWLRAGVGDVVKRIFGSRKKSMQVLKRTDVSQLQEDGAELEQKQKDIIHKKFRKRQISKAWLPTHIYHAKRAHMTLPSEPLWRMAIPLSPTAKSYRPIHRAAGERGAIAWDVSYMSTISLSGTFSSVLSVLQAIGVSSTSKRHMSKWQKGMRTWTGWLHQDHKLIAPATLIWQGQTVMIRVHPSAYLQLWNIILPLARSQETNVVVEDLRFQIGSIEVTGPCATQALIGAIAYSLDESLAAGVLRRMIEVSDASALPPGAIISTQIQDPRLYFPPRKTIHPSQKDDLVRLLAEWPLDQNQQPAMLFDRKARYDAGRRLPTQKAINRRKALASPGEYPTAAEGDPKIPIIVLPTRRLCGGTGSWTVLLPWKCVLPLWYCLMHQPLSTGGNPKLAGLDQKRQLAFESGVPWYPGDYPGTQAGASWEVIESSKRHRAWQRRPKGKRDEYESLTLGRGRKGELGSGWANDWQLLFDGGSATPLRQAITADLGWQSSGGETRNLSGTLVTVKVMLLTRGVPCTCARVYRLPQSSKELREQWLALLTASRHRHVQRPVKKLASDAPAHERRRALAAALLDGPDMPRTGSDEYPDVPDVDDLIGFVTTGNFNLSTGKGMAIANLAVERIAIESCVNDNGKDNLSNICIVRNAGQRVGRLARWEFVDCC